jgi:hypothetical protein
MGMVSTRNFPGIKAVVNTTDASIIALRIGSSADLMSIP